MFLDEFEDWLFKEYGTRALEISGTRLQELYSAYTAGFYKGTEIKDAFVYTARERDFTSG